tara:strand:- start:281 stop:721 length:441 start_codon:yes stop_codon:yes gene_type:complete
MSYLDLLTDDLLIYIFEIVESKFSEDIYKLSVKVQDVEWDIKEITFNKIPDSGYFASYSGILFDWLFDEKKDLFKPFHYGEVRFYNEQTNFISKKIINPNYYTYLKLGQEIDELNDDIFNVLEEPEMFKKPEYDDITIFRIDLRTE